MSTNLYNIFSSLNPNEVKILETFSTYKIFTLELISLFCNTRKEKSKSDAQKTETPISDTASENSSSLIFSNVQSNEIYLNSKQELKLINLILKSIKSADIDITTQLQTLTEFPDFQPFIKELQDRFERLSRNLLLELKLLINALKIYFIGPNLTECFIKPWSVVGKYVRRCIIIYEKMSFDKLVNLSKQASIEFKHFNNFLSQPIQKNKNEKSNLLAENLEHHYEIDNSTSPMRGEGLFLNDESNLTITSEWFNRSNNAEFSCMDLEPLDESLTHSHSIHQKPISSNRLNQKALTSTVSAQRTQSLSNFKSSKTDEGTSRSDANNELRNAGTKISTVKFQLPLQKETSGVLEGSIMGPNDMNTVNKITSFQSQNAIEFSRKTAEFFVAKQANLLENNEHDSMDPFELQQKINELLSFDSNFSDAYYLRYLNFLRLKDYPSALKALHDYFDRYLAGGSISLAALNLCSLEYRFDNKENAFFALKEAITSAHQEGDTGCLQHCLSWLYKIEPSKNGNLSRKDFLIKNACSRSLSNELYNLAAYNLQYFARNNIGKFQPNAILNLLNKTDFVNLKMNSKMELTLLSQCNKASVWNLYGQRKISGLYSQMLLNLQPKSNSIKLNTESQCIAMCFLALDYARNGMYSTSENIISLCKELYSANTKFSEHWLYTENLIAIEKNSNMGKWNIVKNNVERLATINIQQALLQEMHLYILECNFDKAKEVGNKILSNLSITSKEPRNMFENANQFEFLNEQININLRLNYILIYIGLRDYPNALIAAIKFYHEIRQLDFNYEHMVSCLLIAKILIFMEQPDQAIKYLKKCIVFILSNGSLLDQSKLHYLYAKCLHLLDKTKNIDSCIIHMNKCIEKLENIEGSVYLISAYSYMALLMNEVGNTNQRNTYVHKFRKLRQQLPLVGFLL
ncbi:unnamed protein product [Brachionus calyciflorus]|uniref:Anaphase-promoting complex subunit 5 n=1 Tax=Brachionus calyciflorus TaxID=104777 RepID=A0A813M619_9BILA|nr:unnamed protein product [Brachionus calyciflorus]